MGCFLSLTYTRGVVLDLQRILWTKDSKLRSCSNCSRTFVSRSVFIHWDTDRGERIKLKNLPIMLCCTAPKFYLLCSNIAPTMLIQNQVAYTSSVSKAVCVLLQQFSEVIYLHYGYWPAFMKVVTTFTRHSLCTSERVSPLGWTSCS